MSAGGCKQNVGKNMLSAFGFPLKKQIVSIGSKGISHFIIESQNTRVLDRGVAPSGRRIGVIPPTTEE